MEAIQWTFTYKITEVQHLNYYERLHELKLYSLQRRRERYIIIYIWKIIINKYGAKYWWHNGAHNKKQKTSKTWNTVRYSVSNKQKPEQSLQENAITVFGPRLYTSSPKTSESESVKNWKIQIWARRDSWAHFWSAKNAQLCHRIRKQ